MTEKSEKLRQSEQTREALIATGLRLFGEKGFEATSTREIAAEASANIASIAYHFGGKDGLRLACVESIASRMSAVIGRTVLSSDPGGSPEAALDIIEAALTGFVGFIVGRPEARDIAPFMMREMGNPGIAFDRIYADLIQPVHTRLCRLWGVATGLPSESPSVRLIIFTIIGQVLYFRIGRAAVLKRMGWSDFGPAELEAVTSVITGNLRALARAGKAEPA